MPVALSCETASDRPCSMSDSRIGLSDHELSSLAAASGVDRDELAADLRRRPWSIHDLLSDPDLVRSVREPVSLTDATSPFVFFAVLTRLAADDLLSSSYVNDWVGPRSRLPVFDVEPVQEFVAAPGRVLFVARLLTSMVGWGSDPLPVSTTDPWEVVTWLVAVDSDDRVVLLRRFGDLALFMAGVHADALGPAPLSASRAEQVGRSLGMTGGEVLSLADPASPSPGLDTLERLGARSYHEARRTSPEITPVVSDVAELMTAARRFLTHLHDEYLATTRPTSPIAA